MDIVIAAEKPSIAKLLGEHIRRNIEPEEIKVSENPDETGSFYIGFDLDQYILVAERRNRVKHAGTRRGCSIGMAEVDDLMRQTQIYPVYPQRSS